MTFPQPTHIQHRHAQSWELDQIKISHNIIDYYSFGKTVAKNDAKAVRLHFGLQGSYSFNYSQLNSSYA